MLNELEALASDFTYSAFVAYFQPSPAVSPWVFVMEEGRGRDTNENLEKEREKKNPLPYFTQTDFPLEM